MRQLRHNYLTLELPDDWEDASNVTALGPEQDGFRPNLIFSEEPTAPGETAREFAARQFRPLRTTNHDYFIVKEAEAKFGENEGFLREHFFATERGDIGQWQFYCVKNERAYVFTFTNLRDRFAATRSTAESLLTAARLGL